jgi:hypothetical protein
MAVIPTGGVVLDQSALATGFLAAAIAVGGFIGRSQQILARRSEDRIQRATVIGGLYGLFGGLLLVIVDQIAS